jgi:hypothetical protein
MKRIRNLLVLTIAILGFSTIDVSAQRYTNNNVSPQTIERRVFKELIKLNHYGVFDNLKYKVDGNTVTLYGKVFSRLRKKARSALPDALAVSET